MYAFSKQSILEERFGFTEAVVTTPFFKELNVSHNIVYSFNKKFVCDSDVFSGRPFEAILTPALL